MHVYEKAFTSRNYCVGQAESLLIMPLPPSSFTGLSTDVLEAASIDGATGLQKMKSIILPLMVPSFVICLFLTLSRAFMVYDVNQTLTGGEPYGSTRLVAMHVYEKAFTSRNYGVGQAEALILFIIVACISGAQITP